MSGGFFGLNTVVNAEQVIGNALSKSGFFGERAVVSANPAIQSFTAGGPNSTGPWTGAPLTAGGGSNNQGAYGDGNTNGGVSYGSLTPSNAAINGALVSGIGDDDDGATKYLCVILTGTHAQNFFTSITFGAPISVTLTTATATLFNNAHYPGFTGWFWVRGAIPFFVGSTVTVSYT